MTEGGPAARQAAAAPDRPRPRQPFRLVRWFAALGLLCVLLSAAGTAFVLERFLTRQMLRHDAELSAEFIDSLVRAEGTWAYFSNPMDAPSRAPLESFFGHVANLPGVVRANIFSRDGTVLWSSTPELIGRRYPDNHELDRTLRDEVVVTFGTVEDASKPEHERLQGRTRFMEAYLPIHGEDRHSVIGAVEIYRIPHALFASIDEGVLRIRISAALGALLLYCALIGIAVRASRIIQRQQAQLLEAEGLATMGAIASAVAHGVRNPLASIRSSAELAMGESGQGLKECLADIQREADRMEGWVRGLLLQARGDQVAPGSVDVNALVEESLRSFRSAAERQGIRVTLDAARALPPARANPGPLAQAIENLIANAVEAMAEGGELRIDTRAEDGMVRIRVGDNGPGMPEPWAKGRAPLFASTKPQGTGLGLALARRIARGYGGALELRSVPAQGTVAILSLPQAEG